MSENTNILSQCAVKTARRAQGLCPPAAVLRVYLLSCVLTLPLLCSSAATLSPWQRCKPTLTGSPSSTAKSTGRTRSSSSLSSPPLWRRSPPSSALRYLRQRWAEAGLRREQETLQSCCVGVFNGLLWTTLWVLMGPRAGCLSSRATADVSCEVRPRAVLNSTVRLI